MRAEPVLRNAILDAAAVEFAEHGYDAASLNRILLAAGLSKGAFYYYFDDKADLAATVLEREMHKFDLSGLRTPSSADEFWREVSRFTREQMQQLRESPQRTSVITRLGVAVGRHPEIMERCGEFMAKVQGVMTAFWAGGQALGAVRVDLPVAALVAVAQAGKTALATALLPTDRAATPEELDAFAVLHLDLIRRIAEPRASAPTEEPR